MELNFRPILIQGPTGLLPVAKAQAVAVDDDPLDLDPDQLFARDVAERVTKALGADTHLTAAIANAERVVKALNAGPRVRIAGDVAELGRALYQVRGKVGDYRAALGIVIKSAVASGHLAADQVDGATVWARDGVVHIQPPPGEPAFAMTTSQLQDYVQGAFDATAAAQIAAQNDQTQGEPAWKE